MADADRLLDAGALLPLNAAVKDRDTLDSVSARGYSHPALPEPIVRLTPDSLAPGEDLALETLGFDSPQVVGPLASQRRQALGFPAWALINDPDHASFALAVVKDMNREKRRAKSKPGHAYDGCTEIAKQLGRSVAHFLPSYWEEVGRVFLQFGNTTYASRAFSKAREAERVHALEVDEELRRDTFLEFALAGAVTVKALGDYGKELTKNLPPEQAWELFAELCLRRTLGGMPPWATMHRELDRLLKQTGLDRKQTLKEFVAEVIQSPSIEAAPDGFWKGMSDAVKLLAAESPEAAGLLLNMLPQADCGLWLELLDKWGVLENLWTKDATAAEGPQGGAAAWLSRAIRHQRWSASPLLDVVPRMAERLRQDGDPVQVVVAGWQGGSADLNLVDLLLELKAPVAAPPAEAIFRLRSDWCLPPEGVEPRDPVHVAADQRFTDMLRLSVEVTAGDDDFERVATGKTAMAEARKAWLLDKVASCQAGALVDAGRRLNVIENQTRREIFQEFPEAFTALRQVDILPCLQRTLQSGLLDEYGWPALEEAVEELNPDGKTRLQFYGAFPCAIVSNGAAAVVVERDQVAARHELRLPKQHDVQTMVCVDGQLAVYFRAQGKTYVTWSEAPTKKHELERAHVAFQIGGAMAPLGDGGVFTGNEAFYAAETGAMPKLGLPVFDGQHMWEQSRDSQWNTILREWDKDTPAGKGRQSMPAFFEDFLEEGDQLIVGESYLLHYGDLVAESPMGSRDGLIGARSKSSGEQRTVEDVTGRAYSAELRTMLPIAFLNQVEGEGHCLVAATDFWKTTRWRSHVMLYSADGEQVLGEFEQTIADYNGGQAAVLPPLYWHLLQPRDPANSKRLRQLDEKQTRRLLEAAQQDAQGDAAEAQALDAVMDELFPKLHARLRLGIRGIVRRAIEVTQKLDELLGSRDPDKEDAFGAEDELLQQQATRRLHLHRQWRATKGPLLPHLDGFAKLLRGELKGGKVPACDVDWRQLLDYIDAALWRQYWESYEDEEPLAAVLWLLEGWSKIGLADLPGSFRCVRGEPVKDAVPVKNYQDSDYQHAVTVQENGNTYLILSIGYRHATVLEYSPSGKFAVPSFMNHESDEELKSTADSATLQSLAEKIRSQPRPELSSERLDQLAEELGVERAVAAMLWVGGAHMSDRSKNFLSKSLRTSLGLKVAEADEARNLLVAMDDSNLKGIVSAMVRADPWNALEDALSALREAWQKVVGRRIHLPGPVMSDLKDLGYSLWANYYNLGPTTKLPEFLEMIGSPETNPVLQEDPPLSLSQQGWSVSLAAEGDVPCYSSRHLKASVRAMALLNYHLPVGDLARAALPAFYTANRDRLKKPNLLLNLGTTYITEDADARRLAKSLLAAPKDRGDYWEARRDGIVLMGAERQLLAAFQSQAAVEVDGFRRAKEFVDVLESKTERFDRSDALLDYAMISASGMWEMMRRIESTPLPEGSWEQNPLLSTPDLVQQIAEQEQLSSEAAAYYLQLLALPDPTDKLVKLWNDWKPAALKKAAAVLVDKGLALEAKRARAGRKVFLPGAWEALKQPHLPLETWKLPLFKAQRLESGQLIIPLERLLPLQPLNQHFAAAWQRVQDGDKPMYEEVE